MPFLGEKSRVCLWKKERKKTNNKNMEGLGPSEVVFGPPHLTLKPSKKNNPPPKKKNKQNTKIPKKSFSVISQFFFLVGVQNFLSYNLAKKTALKKHYKIGVSARHFLKKRYASRNGHFWNKKSKSRNTSYHCFAYFFFFNNKNMNISWTPFL